jgi:hypothetical protein
MMLRSEYDFANMIAEVFSAVEDGKQIEAGQAVARLGAQVLHDIHRIANAMENIASNLEQINFRQQNNG